MHDQIWRNENLNHKQPPASPLNREHQTLRIHRINPPIAYKKKQIAQTGKETTHRDLQQTDPNPFAGSPKTKELFVKADSGP